jgi:arylsulfatase A-like enzyme
MNLYDPDGLRMRENWVDDVRLGLRIDVAGYYAAITFIDNEVGRLLDALAETGQAENTIVLLTSDHGDMLGSHGTNLKRKPWQESIQVPGILRYPAAVESNQKTDLLASHVDVVPTLLGLARVETEVEMDGQDLSPHLFSAEQGGQAEESAPESVYLQSYTATERNEHEPWRGVRTEQYTYAQHADRSWVLYDNQADPYQSDNLAGKPEHAELEGRLKAMTTQWFESTGDDWTELHDRPYR